MPGTAVGLSSGGRGAGDLNTTYPARALLMLAASRRHPRRADWDIMSSPFTCILVGAGDIPGYSRRVE